ncbi:hypothetical protein ADUPG1_006134, partial [Aduncisulcus paluster]
MKVVLKFFHLPAGSSASSELSPLSVSQYQVLMRSALSPRLIGQCPFIVPLLCSFLDVHAKDSDKYGAYLVFPFFPQGDMLQWIEHANPTISQLHHVLRCVLRALAFLHSHNIVHCDLKLQNILIDDDGNGILCDFEGAVDCSERTMRLISPTMKIGTQMYMAPEIDQAIKDRVSPHPTPSSDVFSFGVLLQCVFSEWEGGCMPAEVEGICKQCMDERPENRPSAAQILMLKWFRPLVCEDKIRMRSRKDRVMGSNASELDSHPDLIQHSKQSSQIHGSKHLKGAKYEIALDESDSDRESHSEMSKRMDPNGFFETAKHDGIRRATFSIGTSNVTSRCVAVGGRGSLMFCGNDDGTVVSFEPDVYPLHEYRSYNTPLLNTTMHGSELLSLSTNHGILASSDTEGIALYLHLGNSYEKFYSKESFIFTETDLKTYIGWETTDTQPIDTQGVPIREEEDEYIDDSLMVFGKGVLNAWLDAIKGLGGGAEWLMQKLQKHFGGDSEKDIKDRVKAFMKFVVEGKRKEVEATEKEELA